jgi:hypothetical protein
MRNAIIRAYTLGILTGTALTAALVMLAAPAHADTPDPSPAVLRYTVHNEAAICSALGTYNNIPGVLQVLQAIQADGGFSEYEAGEVVGLSVTDLCPTYVPLLQKFVRVYGSATA